MNQATSKLITGVEAIDFELGRSALQARRNAKWNQYEPDVLPAFIAEMDFAVAAPIQAAIERIVRDRDFGYPQRDGKRVDAAVAAPFVAGSNRARSLVAPSSVNERRAASRSARAFSASPIDS